MTKNGNFGPNVVILGGKSLIITGESKSYGTHITEKTPRHLVCIVFWSGMGSDRPKMPIFGKKCQILAKSDRFWSKNPYFGGLDLNFGIREPFSMMKTLNGVAPIGR